MMWFPGRPRPRLRGAAAGALAGAQELERDLDLEALLARHDEEELTSLLMPPAACMRYAERTGEPVLHLPSACLDPGRPGADRVGARRRATSCSYRERPSSYPTTASNPRVRSWSEWAGSRRR